MNQKKRRSAVYRITNTKNGKSYIGCTNLKKPINRFKKHILISKNKTLYLQNQSFQELHQAIIDDGIDSFIFEVLEECIPSIRFEREQYWVRKLGTFGVGGYNRTKGGKGSKGVKVSDDQKKRLREMNRGKTGDKNPMFGRKLTEEHKKKLAEGRAKSRRGKKNPFYGKHHTEEVRQATRERNAVREEKREWVEKRLKLSADDVVEIRRLYQAGESVPSLATKYSVSKPCIYKVLKFERKIDKTNEQ